GISPYIDFIAGIVFTSTSYQNLSSDLPLVLEKIENPTAILGPALQLSCPEFIETCLLRFNEHLLNIVDSDITIGGTIGASPLETYAKLHPFAQATEHLLAEKYLHTLM
ncbi:hypothetical protein HOY82DRAFT_466643, partial [Tuber indicum]